MSDPRAPRPAADSRAEVNHIVLPGEANSLGAAYGGHVMSWIDMTGAIAAQRHCRMTAVTASMDDLHFHAPIRVGWIAVLHARVLAAFNTSMEVGVTMHAENPRTGEKTLTTSALLTFVALDDKGVRGTVPPLLLVTPEGRPGRALKLRHPVRFALEPRQAAAAVAGHEGEGDVSLDPGVDRFPARRPLVAVLFALT
jgi:acyl-CoA hydrolase